MKTERIQPPITELLLQDVPDELSLRYDDWFFVRMGRIAVDVQAGGRAQFRETFFR